MSLSLEPKASLQCSIFILILFIGAMLSLLKVNIPLILKIFGIIICLFSGSFYLRKYAWLTHKKSIVRLIAKPKGGWQLFTRDGSSYIANIRGDSLLTRWLIILNLWSRPQSRVSIVLFPDSLDNQTLRRLRVYLNTS